MNNRDIKQRLKQQLAQKQDEKPRHRSVICASDGSRVAGSFWADESAKIVYQQRFGSGGVGRALCTVITPELGLGVEVSPIDNRLAEWEVVGPDPFLRRTATDNRNYQTIAPTDLQPGGRLMLWVDSRQIEPLATWDTAGTLQVNVTAGDYPYLGARKSFAGQNGIDLTASVPGGGLTRYVGLYLDASNALQTVNGATTTIGLTPAEPTWPAGAFRLSVVQLDNGQTSIDFANDILDRRMAWSDDNSGGGTAATQAEVDAGTNTTKFVTPSTLANFAPLELKVKNTSGSTVTPGWVGYIVWVSGSGLEFKATTTGSVDAATACTVLVGAANNADIIVASRGRFSLLYSGTAPSQGDFLIFNGSGAVVRQTYMSPDVMAIAMAAGSGGSVDALMLTGTKPVQTSSATRIYSVISHSNTAFVATINGAPTATSVVYNAPSSGNEDVINNQAAGQLGKAVLWNSTRSTGRLIDSVNTGTNTITTVSSTDAWASGDTITIESQTVTTGITQKAIEIDLSQQSVVPVLARAIMVHAYKLDSGAIGQLLALHPVETYAASKHISIYTHTGSTYTTTQLTVNLTNRRFAYLAAASGAGTAQVIFELAGYHIAVP